MIVNMISIAIIFILIVFLIVMNNENRLTENQILIIKEWLKWVVVEAEKQLGSQMGQIKLRYAYNLAVETFPNITQSITFEQFGEWVDEALDWMKNQLNSNKAVKEYINS